MQTQYYHGHIMLNSILNVIHQIVTLLTSKRVLPMRDLKLSLVFVLSRA